MEQRNSRPEVSRVTPIQTALPIPVLRRGSNSPDLSNSTSNGRPVGPNAPLAPNADGFRDLENPYSDIINDLPNEEYDEHGNPLAVYDEAGVMLMYGRVRMMRRRD
jgi:hypothetical protein